MGSVWTGISDNTGIVKIWSDVVIDGVGRTNNTVYITNLYVRNWTPTGGAYNNTPWYDDVYFYGGGAIIPGTQSKGTTSGVIANNNYYCAGATFNFGVGTWDGSFNLAHRINTDGVWRGWIQPIGVGIPGVSYPTLDSQSVSNIKPKQATVNWGSGTGANCTFSAAYIEYGLSTSYTGSVSVAQSGSHTLTGLAPGKTYHYRFVLYNGASLQTVSSDYTFKTKAVPGMISVIQAMV